MNARCSPERILAMRSSDQFARLAIDTRTTATRPGLPTPVGPEALSVPAQHRLRLDDDQSGSPAGPDLGNADPEHAVAPGEADTASAQPLLEHRHLLSQRNVLPLPLSPRFSAKPPWP